MLGISNGGMMNPVKSTQLKNSAAITFVAALLAALAIAQTPDSVKLPETPAGKTFGAFLVALNSGNLETMRRFHSDHGGNVDNAEQDMEFYNQSGGLVLHSAKASGEFEIEALVQTKKDGNWLNFTMRVESSAPYPPAGIRAQPAEAPRDAPKSDAGA